MQQLVESTPPEDDYPINLWKRSPPKSRPHCARLIWNSRSFLRSRTLGTPLQRWPVQSTRPTKTGRMPQPSFVAS